MELTNSDIVKAIIRSQHCQRNWDLSKQIPEEDLEVIKTSVTQCPSKQNIAYYDTYFITNRDVIERIHAATDGFILNKETKLSTTNTQTLANLLIAFVERDFTKQFTTEDKHRNLEMDEIVKGADKDSKAYKSLDTDRKIAVGVAAGYCNMTSSLLGYSTGCCTCFDKSEVKKILNIDSNVMLLMGVGFSQQTVNRRVHHLDSSIVFPTKQKVEIKNVVIS